MGARRQDGATLARASRAMRGSRDRALEGAGRRCEEVGRDGCRRLVWYESAFREGGVGVVWVT